MDTENGGTSFTVSFYLLDGLKENQRQLHPACITLSVLLMRMPNATLPKPSSLLEPKPRTLFAFPLRSLLALALEEI